MIIKSEKTVTFTGTVGFYSSPTGTNAQAITVWLDTANLENSGTFTACKLDAIDNTKSEIRNMGTIKLDNLSHDNITVSFNQPIENK